ncbi:phasin family protein [Leisingera sp. JC11]|uniref:phasin family protein n=1 Tax=Leisingera sp. JC11 TaxID=3042469 RepID=UPI0034556AD0
MLFNPMYKPQVEQFWNVQEKILDEAEEFTRHWFERRHEAARTALDAARTVVSADPSRPADAFEAFTEWQRHSAERIAEDGREWFGMMSRCARYASETEAEAVGEAAGEAAEITRKAVKRAQSDPV